MCGIFGIFADDPVPAETVQAAVAEMQERGPDDEGYAALDDGNGFVGADTVTAANAGSDTARIPEETLPADYGQRRWFGHRRLAVTGDIHCHQPMNVNEWWLVFEGEIYNFKEVRSRLRDDGYRFETSGDTEVFLKAVDAWGVDGLHRLRGAWAAAVYNEETDTLQCITDAFREIPLYYVSLPGMFAFSSDIRPLFQLPHVTPEPCEQMVRTYLSYGMTDHTRNTFFADIKQLRGGERLVHTGSETTCRRYLDIWDGTPCASIEEAVRQAVRRRIPEEGDMAVTVSGGIDSGITALLADASGADVQYYSVALPGTPDDEAEDVQELADALDIDVERIPLTGEDLLDAVETGIAEQEEPTAMLPFQAQHVLFGRMADAGERVVVQGTGADELFAGYPKFLFHHVADKLRSLRPLSAVRLLSTFSHLVSVSWLTYLVSLLIPAAVRRRIRSIRTPDTARYIQGEVPPFPREGEKLVTLDAAIDQHIRRHWFPSITRSVRKNSITKGVEARAAFLDRDLAATVKTCSADDLFKEGRTKAVLRDAFTDQLPEQICNKKKHGFVTTADHWYTPTTTERFIDRFSSEEFAAADYIDQDKLVADLKDGSLPFDIAYRAYVLDHWLSAVEDWRTG